MSGMSSECQTVRIQIRHEILLAWSVSIQRISADDASRQPVNMHLGPDLQCLLRVKVDLS